MHKSLLCVTLIAIAVTVALGGAKSAYSAATITVNTTTDEAVTDGNCSLREAITNANANADATGGDCVAGSPGADTMILASLTGTITLGLGNLPSVTDDLTIGGPGASALTINADGNERVFFVVGHRATITGLTLTGAAGFSSFGGGVVVYAGGSLTVENSTINGNSTSFYGGGINGFFDFSGSVTVSNSTISGNTGAGIASDVTLTITNSTISGNSGNIGAGIINNGLGVLRNSTVSGNSGGSGGGILNNGDLTVENSTISGNTASQGAGIYSDAPLAIRNSTISGNSASQVGGGIIGGALIENSTISGNSAGLFGGGMFGGASTLRNTIVAGQIAGGNCFGTIINDGGYNLEDGTSCGLSTSNNSLPSTNPSLDPAGLKDNGGPTQTIALVAGSPAIDAVPSGVNSCGATLTSDQRGVSRPQGPGCDIGAFELVQETPAQLLADLSNLVEGIGPGTSLADKVTKAQTYLRSNDVPDTCSTLNAFINEVKAQKGKTINPPSLADDLIARARRIKTLLGC